MLCVRRISGGNRKGWQTKVWFNGVKTSVVDMVTKYGHVCEYDGNSKDGWFVYLRNANGVGIDISPFFGRENGDTLRDMKEAFGRVYGADIALSRGRKIW